MSADTVYILVGLAVAAYLLGSISFGFVLGKLKGVDLRTVGSKNIGATNAGRVLGKQYFIFVLLLDLLKGFIPVLIAGRIITSSAQETGITPSACWLWLLVGFAAVVGHNWSVFLKFKGGKGVATSLGVALGIFPYYTLAAVIAVLTFIIVHKSSGYVSLGSILGSAAFAVATNVLILAIPDWKVASLWPLMLFALLMGTVLIAKHKSNIQRLRNGTENRAGNTSTTSGETPASE